MLHGTNLILFITYLIAVVFEISLGRSISQTFLVILASYLVIHFAEAFILKKYEKTKTIESFARTTETHTSRTLELFVFFMIVSVALVLLINIWGFEDWLQTTSVLGFLALFIFASKEYWAGDFLSGILIISQGRIERGDVIKVRDEGLTAIVLQINSFQTIVRDLVNKHDVILPNSRLRIARVDVLKTDLAKGIREFEDFYFGYGTDPQKIKDLFDEVWAKVVEEDLIDNRGDLVVANKECGDHGVRWRLAYTLKSPHRIIEAGNRVPVAISADVTTTNLSNLATAINKVSSETGVVAVTSADYARIILISDAGDDIAVSGLGNASPEFSGRLVNKDAVAQTSPVGAVTSSGAFKTPLSLTNVVTDALVSGATVSSSTVAGTGADLSVSSDTNGNYTLAINSGGSGSANPYVVGETFTVDGTLVGGSSPTHDVTITVTSVDANGLSTAATASGFAPGITQAQTTITPTITSGLGAGASFDVTLTDGVATVAVNSAGDGYDENDTFTILGSALGGTDGVNDLTISVASLATTSMVSFGAVVSGNRIDTGRFSGEVSLSSSSTFSLTTTNGTSNAAQDPTLGSFVNVQTNIAGDTKTITYDINEALENGGSGLNGLKAVAPKAAYGLTVPSSNGSISFSADISSSELSTVSIANVNKALVKEIRDQAPLASLSGGSTVSTTQVVSYSFQRTEAVQPTVDSVTITINNTDISVDLTDIDGANTSASSAADVTAAIVRAVNNSTLEITASTSGTAPDYGVTLTANKSGEAFTVEAFSFNDVNEIVAQTQFSLTTETPAKSLPSDGSSVAIKFGDQIYSLTMVEGEVVVSGAEAGRITAYFDASSRLQIFGGGSLSGATISVVSDPEIGGNSAAAAAFGLEGSTARLTGQLFTLTSGMDDLELDFNGTAVTVSLDLSGNVTTVPSSVTGLTLSWEAESATTGRLKAEISIGTRLPASRSKETTPVD